VLRDWWGICRPLRDARVPTIKIHNPAAWCKGSEMEINYRDIAVSWQKIADDGFRYKYENGIKIKVTLSELEVSEAIKTVKHYYEMADEYNH